MSSRTLRRSVYWNQYPTYHYVKQNGTIMFVFFLLLFFFIFCLFQVTGNFMHFCKYSAYSRYKSTVDFMYNHIKLLSVPMPLHMKVEFIR